MVRGHLEQVAKRACMYNLNSFVVSSRTMILYPTPPNCSQDIDGDGSEWVLTKGDS